MPQSNNYKWIDNHQQERNVQNLSIPSATVNDTGHYTCVVSVNGFYSPLSGTSITTVTVWCKYICYCGPITAYFMRSELSGLKY